MSHWDIVLKVKQKQMCDAHSGVKSTTGKKKAIRIAKTFRYKLQQLQYCSSITSMVLPKYIQCKGY